MKRLGWLSAARVLAVTLLVVIIALAISTQRDEADELGPFPTGDGDAVNVAPRALP